MDKGGAENEPEPKINSFGSATLNFLFLRVLYIFLIYIEFILSMLINWNSEVMLKQKRNKSISKALDLFISLFFENYFEFGEFFLTFCILKSWYYIPGVGNFLMLEQIDQRSLTSFDHTCCNNCDNIVDWSMTTFLITDSFG